MRCRAQVGLGGRRRAHLRSHGDTRNSLRASPSEEHLPMQVKSGTAPGLGELLYLILPMSAPP